MTWTSPRTWVAGEVVTAAIMNLHVRDNLNFGVLAGADLASAATVTPTAETHLITGTTTIDNVSTTGAVKGQPFRMVFQGAVTTVRHNGGGTGNIRLASAQHAAFVPNEALSLVFDGTNWIETHRSPKHLSGESIKYNWTNGTNLTGYLPEDGSAISRTTYLAYFANIGTVYGVGDGSTTFNLPDTRGRMDVGHALSGGHTDVSTIGGNEGVGTVAFRRPKHWTTKSDPNHGHSIDAGTISHNNGGSNGPTVSDDSQQFSGSVISANAGPTGITVGTGNGNDPVDTPAYLVRPKLSRI